METQSQTPARPVAGPLLVGLLAGLVMGAAVPLAVQSMPRVTASLTEAKLVPASPPVPLSAPDVNTEGWMTYRDTTLGFEIQYPPTYIVTKEGRTTTVESVSPNPEERATITLDRVYGSIQSTITPSMQYASWKVLDREAYALATPYFGDQGEADLTAEYLFILGYHPAAPPRRPGMVRARIHMSSQNPELALARQARITDLSGILTMPEQILSRFRFLQDEELYDPSED